MKRCAACRPRRWFDAKGRLEPSKRQAFQRFEHIGGLGFRLLRVQSGNAAYSNESWAGCAPGEGRLQRQVLALFEKLDIKPEHVLAGNLVPFRSPDWRSLKDQEASVKFGMELWAEILRTAKPSLVITMGSQATRIVANLLGVVGLAKQRIGWGRVAAYRAPFDGGRLIGLPHLSRFGVITRPQSSEALEKLLSISLR